MMQYTTQQGTQGICPPGWRLPTDEEWMVLEGASDSQYGIGDPEWDLYNEFRGYDAATNLKSTSDWNGCGSGTNLFGFSGLPGGFRDSNGYFYNISDEGIWYTSTEYGDDAWGRSVWYDYPSVSRGFDLGKEVGLSVRCLSEPCMQLFYKMNSSKLFLVMT